MNTELTTRAQKGPRPGVRLLLLVSLASLALSLVVVAFAGCSHTTPYVSTALALVDARELRIDLDAVRTRLLLIGDAGAPTPDDPVLGELSRWGAELPERTTIVYLGDNIYPRGLVDAAHPDHAEMSRRLDAQIDAVSRSGARGLFIPGNHDWAHGGADGLVTLARQERAVVSALGEDAFLPRGGCAGPVAVDLDGLRLVVLDTEWFLQKTPASPCGETRESIAHALGRLVEEAGEREVIVIGHHPIASHGPHGGFFTWQDHIFPLTRLAPWAVVPLPLVGSLYPFVRGTLSPSSQDLGNGRYEAFVETVTGAVRAYTPLAYASGHDHVLQVLDGGDAFRHALVSGAGSVSKVTAVGDGDDTIFAHAHAGFMCLDALDEGRVALRVVEPGQGVMFSKWLTGEEGAIP